MFSQIQLDLVHVKQLGGVFEGHRQLFFEFVPVLLEFLDMAVLQHKNPVLLLLFEPIQQIIPLLVEVLVLLHMRILYFFPLLSLLQKQLFLSFLKILLFQLDYPVLRHFGL